MQRIGDRLVLSATDLTKHLACPHVTTLDRELAWGARNRPPEGIDEQLELIFAKGLEHERRYLAHLYQSTGDVVEIPENVDRVAAEAQTVAAMRAGHRVIYQATLYDGSWVGFADFLLRRDGRVSTFGGYAYDIADTKLARRLKVPALLQMAAYAQRLEHLQGVAPRHLVVVTGDNREHAWRLIDVAAYGRRARARLQRAVADRPPTEAIPNPYCGQCRWQPICAAEWSAADDLSLVAGMRAGHRAVLREAGIGTLEALAGANVEALIADVPGLSRSVGLRLHRQARLQVSERRTGVPSYELLAPEPDRGLGRLPRPDAGDLYLDFEGDPFANEGRGREYLAGLLDREQGFQCWWAHDDRAEAALTAGLLAALVQRWRDYPDMHVYHYAPYEVTALKRLSERYDVGQADLDALLRGGRFVDLYAVVRQGLAISKGSYSIKKLEDFYWGAVRHGDGERVADALSSVVAYERWLSAQEAERDDAILERIRAYNEDDVRSTLALHDWLEDRRAELVAEVGDVARPGEVAYELTADSEATLAERALVAALEEAGEPLLAGLVGWHRREQRPQWWEFFARAEASDEDLVDDASAIGRLGSPVQVGEKLGKNGRVTSRIWRYPFPPQECRLPLGKVAVDVDTREGVGTVIGYDGVQGWLELSRGVKADPATPRAIGPQGPMLVSVLRDALARVGTAALAGEEHLGLALVHPRVPPDLRRREGESTADAVVRVGLRLDGQVLAVQGPPGAGKTYAASRLIRELLDSGRTVGVTANSHAVILNLLSEVGRPALHKAGEPGNALEQTEVLIREVGKNEEAVQALAAGEANLVGGTAWFWARAELADAVDVLVVDEAGQFSLANAVAVAQAARRGMVLLGDPQQLTQPTHAEHPHGAGVSALKHLIGASAVIPPEQGLFLDRTWRMHPSLTSYVSELFYDSELRSADGRDRQVIRAPGALTGAGVRWIPVEHDGNVADSPQEAEAVAALVADLLAGTWVDVEGAEHPLTAADVLVVAPYNAHVARISTVLEAAGHGQVQVGTVDRFQGRQAPVVIYSMASSSAADAPRGVAFLFDPHRLNVAVSRAKALAVIVGSPALVDAPVSAHQPEHLRAVNSLCEYVDRAQRGAAADAAAAAPTTYETLALPGLEDLPPPPLPRGRRR
ncbi:MAG: TM0106 family RecB-like putative nuclease [Austwickia sp.]|nr:TM0106 family RecB-like putative nuclease [Austwickia sp.]MBK8435094.1 TM0106 family RecB-like putative nuclease [Austwickia sp.]